MSKSDPILPSTISLFFLRGVQREKSSVVLDEIVRVTVDVVFIVVDDIDVVLIVVVVDEFDVVEDIDVVDAVLVDDINVVEDASDSLMRNMNIEINGTFVMIQNSKLESENIHVCVGKVKLTNSNNPYRFHEILACLST